MIYVTDSLRLAGEHKRINKRWIDLARPSNEEIDAAEIVNNVIENAGLVVV